MPELPELEVVQEILQRRVVGRAITDAQLVPPGGPIVARDIAGAGFEAALSGAVIAEIRRRGKFLVFGFHVDRPPLFLAINPKLTGRLQLAEAADKRFAKTHLVLSLDDGRELRYIDQKQMGQL